MYFPLTGSAYDIAIDDFGREIEKITHMLRGHDAILAELEGEIENIRSKYIGTVKKSNSDTRAV